MGMTLEVKVKQTNLRRGISEVREVVWHAANDLLIMAVQAKNIDRDIMQHRVERILKEINKL